MPVLRYQCPCTHSNKMSELSVASICCVVCGCQFAQFALGARRPLPLCGNPDLEAMSFQGAAATKLSLVTKASCLT